MKLTRGYATGWSAIRFPSHIQAPLFDAPESGGSGGGQPAIVAGGGGGAAPPAYKLTGDSMVDFGDGKPVKWSEAQQSRYIPKEQYDRGVQFLTAEATKLEKAWEKYRDGTGPKPPAAAAAPKTDILDEIRDLAVVDGATAAKLVRALREEGLGPLAQIVAQMHAKMTAMEGRLGSVGQVAGHLGEQSQAAGFEASITTALGALGPIKGLPDGVALDTADPFLREAAKDLYLSHDQKSWRAGEFEKMLRTRIEGAVALTRALDKKAVAAAGEKRKKFFDPSRGGGRPSGEGAYKHLNGTAMAEALFGQLDGGRT